jgi:SulP family sulfate permease
VVWSVVTPQAVAYAQIAGLPPQAGLVAAPGALLGYALLGNSRTLIVSATTATSALSAAAVGPLANGDTARFAALSAGLALVAAAALAAGGALRLGALTDLVSKPVLTGFMFGLGVFIAVGQLPKLLGVEGGGDSFLEQLEHLHPADAHAATLAVGAASVAGLLALKRLAPKLPGTLIVLAAAIALSALLGLDGHGVAVVGKLPDALPDPAVPDVSWDDVAALLPTGIGIMVLTTEAVGVARALASQDGYAVDVNREMVALGAANALAGLSSGFVQSGGASQTAAAEAAGGRTQLTAVIAGVLIVLTGAFLSPLFTDLPEATLGAIVAVAVSGFWRVDELRRMARLRTSAIVLALSALAGVLALGVLQGLLVAAGLSLALIVYRLSRPEVGVLAQDPATGAWGQLDRHPDWEPPRREVVVRVDGPLFYANAAAVKDRLQALARPGEPLVLVLDQDDIDVESLDMLAELAQRTDLRLSGVREPVRRLLARAGLALPITPSPSSPPPGAPDRRTDRLPR